MRSTLKLLVAALAAVALDSCVAAAPALAAAADAPYTIAAVRAQSAPPNAGTITEAWRSGTQLQLGWDLPNGRPAREATSVFVVLDAHAVYVAFDAAQSAPVTATQRSNNAGEGSDDEVHVAIWPSGRSGFRYEFIATPLGTRYQHSTENDAYAPQWQAAAVIRPGGYSVTMAIPFESMRADGHKTWLVQFWRDEHQSGELYLWSHAPGQTDPRDTVYAGSLEGMASLVHARTPEPRIGVYALAQAGAPSAGGDTSRIGLDAALPFTPTASALITIHPDYSNVEVDQQTIAPTAFVRTYNEVRPFFTQGANLYNNISCYGCPGILPIYTPNVPTPRRGWAVEGIQGPLRFATFTAVGAGRTDSASGIALLPDDRRWFLGETSTWSNIAASDGVPAVHDTATTFSASFNDQKHWQAYADYGFDRGTNVLDSAQGQYEDAGFAWYTKDDFDAFTMRKLGRIYDPVAGYVQLTDIAGYSGQINRTFHFAATSPIREADLNLFFDDYASTAHGTNLFDANENFALYFKNRFDVGFALGASAAMLPGDVLRPYTQNGVRIDYDRNRPTQDTLAYAYGAYAAGFLGSWTRIVALPAGKRVIVNLEADDTNWAGDGVRLKQWLERAGLTWTITPDATFGLGARRIVGAPPPSGATPADPASTAVNQTNLALALAIHRRHDELYLAYGDPNEVTTLAAFIVKYIYYFGAAKGT